jgi:RimJ/RimL family protein N-acetyltransferase
VISVEGRTGGAMVRLETGRLMFRDHELSDLEPYCEMESDPIYRAPQIVHSRAELERSFRETWMPVKKMGMLATVFREDGRYIGRTGLYPRRTDEGVIVPGEATLAFYIARPYWGRGIATEAGRAFIENGFRELGLVRIHAGMNAANHASVRVIEKLGFTWVRSGGDAATAWHDYELVSAVGSTRPKR